ncbi:class I glutamine amidotransferase-like protein [Xylariales sp. PMI_506]|nr:class I glutamine amidotransferase-like protein [Xylariales sp. PMI_506]
MNHRVTEILDVAPIDLLHGLTKHFTDAMPDEMFPSGVKAMTRDFVFHWVSEKGPSTPSRLTAGMNIISTDSFENCPPLDVVLIGAHLPPYVPNETELAFVRKSWENCSAFLTICGGIDVPLRAGILEGRTVTGPRAMLDMLRQLAPSTEWLEKRWVHDGKLWTSGALLNGADMVHAFAHEHWGSAASGKAGDGEEQESLVGFLAKLGAWPSRDVDYKDVPWKW